MSDAPRHLGKQSVYPQSPDEAVLDCVPAPDAGGLCCVRYTCPEFTSLCPVTGQPDFAHITFDYVPRLLLVESKALKLYMGSFRNHRDFHESTTLRIAGDFYGACNPRWLRIAALWYPRGGIPIDVFWQSGLPPSDIFIPDLDYKHYRGR